jgi:hypothetical protein
MHKIITNNRSPKKNRRVTCTYMLQMWRSTYTQEARGKAARLGKKNTQGVNWELHHIAMLLVLCTH